MNRSEVRETIALGMTGRLSRREAIARLAMLGLSSSAIATALAASWPRPAHAAGPGRRGESGVLKVLYWQAPTIVNPHLSTGTKDFHASRLCLEPLLTVNGAGVFTPVLAADVPSQTNGGVAADGRAVTYKLRPGVKWADGRPFTADDVVFTFQFISNRDTGATTYASYDNIEKVDALDPTTVKITFKAPTPAWFLPFVGENGMVLPRHALESYVGSTSRNAPFNLKAFGTGPYKVESFRPGDLVIYSINDNYRDPTKPAFQQVQIKGGGDATSAARAVLETGEYDYAWNIQVEWPVLEAMAKAGKGVVLTENGSGVEQIYCNMTDPNKEVDGQRSSVKAPHPFLTDLKVRQALGLAIDRVTMAKQLYGVEGEATSNVLTTPSRLSSKNTKIVFDIAKANQLLDEAGWQRGPDGIRQKGGVKLQLTYVTSVNTLRQKEQAIVKDGWTKIGVDVTLGSVDAGVFFSSSPGNNDTYSHFYRDVQMFTSTFSSPFPTSYLIRFYSGDPAKDLAQKENNWSGRNIMRWVNPEFNKLFNDAQSELDPKKNDALWIKMNDLIVSQGISLPLIDRRFVTVRTNNLEVGENLSPFDSETRNIADWRRGKA
ncbi:MAG TPA: peptide ABC transporter substrate-binding protein [Candidatus Dormibacteraeota bacterium]|nr:peptide ABC transporter substrate-binding protein [Candidatus Dormibacteraeota bacterium]